MQYDELAPALGSEIVRIGTWNLAGRWSEDHATFLASLNCDVLLLTEISDSVDLPSHVIHRSTAEMAAKRRWAAVATKRSLVPLGDPHPASAMAIIEGWTFCSSVLPWRSAGRQDPWQGERHAAWTAAAVDELLLILPTQRLVWGGDWNHAMSGPEYSGSKGGRSAIHDAVEKLDLEVATAALPHAIPGLLSIDHIAVPREATVRSCERHVAQAGDGRLSDHDAYSASLARRSC